jgi:alpha-L-fucosidase
VTTKGPFLPTWDSLAAYRVPDWFRDAKFGIFIHWGPYSVPAFGNEWYSRNMYQPGKPEFEHHRQTYGPQSEFGYKDFIPLLTGEHFDPDAWAALFREAGAQYVVPVAEHHDGFAMYRSELNPWNATAMGPKRDVIGELSQAVRARSMVFGLSSHRAENWWFFNGGMTFDSDVRAGKHTELYGPAQPQHMPPSTQFLEEWVEHTIELVDAYEPQLLYFDWWIHRPAYKPHLPHLAAHYYNLMAPTGRDPVLTYKDQAFPPGTAVEDVERGSSATLRAEPWQACTAISRKSWCYLEKDQDYKTAQELAATLADVVSKNGSLLLNVGPKADGTIPDHEQELLRQLGTWLAVNGEAIAVGSPTARHYAALRAGLVRAFADAVVALRCATPTFAPLLGRVPVVLPPVVLYACGGLCLGPSRLLAVVCGEGDQSQRRLRRARLREARGLSSCGLSVRWWRSGWLSPSPGPGGNQTSAGSATGGSVVWLRRDVVFAGCAPGRSPVGLRLPGEGNNQPRRRRARCARLSCCIRGLVSSGEGGGVAAEVEYG